MDVYGQDRHAMVKSSDAVPVHLVTILYNSESSLHFFLSSLLSQDMRNWKLTAIDNASTDTAPRIIQEIADDRIMIVRNATNLGFAKAANQGLKLAARSGAEFSILINNDTVFESDFLGSFVEARNRLQAHVIAPRIMQMNDPAKSWYAGGHFEQDWILANHHDPFDAADRTEWRKVEYASGCCLGVTRQVLETVGLLDESFFVYWEDADYCLRLKAAGIPIFYVRDPFMLHEGGGASDGENTPAHNCRFYRSHMQMLRKHCGMRYAARAMARILLRERERSGTSRAELLTLANAMARGLVARMVPPARLEA